MVPWWVILILVFAGMGIVVDVLCVWFLFRTHYKHDGESTI